MRLASVDSTQRYAAGLAAAGAADGTAVVADTQTAGRGRHGRVWRDDPGASLLLSVILRTTLPSARLPTLSLAAGVAVVEALAAVAGIDPRLKWPNDVLLAGRKVAGILLERHGDGVILGIGVNVGQRAFPPELAERATSLALAGATVDRDALLAALLDGVLRWRDRLQRDGFEVVRARWTALATMLGARVSVDGISGIVRGLDDDGALLIEADTGAVRVLAGEVHEAVAG